MFGQDVQLRENPGRGHEGQLISFKIIHIKKQKDNLFQY